MAEILKGAPVAAAITEALIERKNALEKRGITPCLAILRVGTDEAALAYERNVIKCCAKTGIAVKQTFLDDSCTQEELISAINAINEDDTVHGCLMFRPLPERLDEKAACDSLMAEKDVDSMTTASLVNVFTGRGKGFAPCTAQACIEILDHYGYDPAGKKVAVIGRSLVIGKPVSMLLQARNATVTMCHTKTVDMPGVCRSAEILVTAAGKAGMIDDSYTNENQIIIDVGINAAPDGSICGDVEFEKVKGIVRAITPVPGGVGSVTTAVLCKHVIEAAECSSI